jgi:hypothetical protein
MGFSLSSSMPSPTRQIFLPALASTCNKAHNAVREYDSDTLISDRASEFSIFKASKLKLQASSFTNGCE